MRMQWQRYATCLRLFRMGFNERAPQYVEWIEKLSTNDSEAIEPFQRYQVNGKVLDP